MQERANLLNASLKIDSSPGQGTKISIIVSSGEVSENGKDFDYE
jgi:nitrate/nitrite-specific signal transduction histidine kinase